MSDFGEAIGTALEGGLLAKAVDGRTKTAAPLRKGHFAEGTCLNCGTDLIGAHCHECGQKAHLHRTLGAFLHDLLHGALHLEGRTWKTLPKLVFRPGELTRRYIDGERARFVSPMALFLFSIFLMFAIFQIAGISTPTNVGSPANVSSLEEAGEKAQAEVETAIARVERSAEGSAERREAEIELEAARKALENIGEFSAFTISKDAEINLTGIETIDTGIIEKWRQNPGLMLYKLQTNFYKFSWLLIPLSVPFVWLLFAWRRKFKAYDHAIFVTYSLCFMTLLTLAITMAGIAGLPTPLVVFASVFIPPIHIYKQLRGAYGLSRFSAFWRLGVLSIFIVIVLTIFLQLLLLLGAF